MRRLLLLPLLAVLIAPAAADASTRPGEVVVRFRSDTSATARAAAARASGAERPSAVAPQARVLRLRRGQTMREALRALRGRPDVESANPNYVAHASEYIPNDPGKMGGPTGWAQLQWNLLAGTGVDAPTAWARLAALGRPGGKGVKVAVLDTGVAYRTGGRYRRSPDLRRETFVRGYDFVGRDSLPMDENGHGTHVASTIAEATGNGIGLAGLAYGAKIMPVRVLDRAGAGDVATIARGIRFAARKRVPIINLSFEFETGPPNAVTSARQIPEIISAIRYADQRGSLVIGAAGNESSSPIAFPARSSRVLAVGAVTEHGCQAEYSNEGSGLDIAAPGGGADAVVADDLAHCHPDDSPGRDIFQMTFSGSVRSFGMPSGYQGTSMATPHVSAIAALVIASRVVGSKPSPSTLRRRLLSSVRDLGPRGPDPRYGAGMIDAALAVGAKQP